MYYHLKMILSSSRSPSPIGTDWKLCAEAGENSLYVAWLVLRVRERFQTLGLDYSALGQCKGRIYVFINEPEDAVDMLKLLEQQESEITQFVLL